MVQKKFHFVVAMQRYEMFSQEELQDVEFLLDAYPSLKIAYLKKEMNDGTARHFSCLIDSSCGLVPNELRRIPRFCIELPGPPILGDGKSDNQNTSAIYARGEFIQLIDANQDQYWEEALKIRQMLSEFGKIIAAEDFADDSSPVAIVGAREHIFSERIGALGDVAAGKEYTFGTITQRVMALLGGRSSYGHPDIMNVRPMPESHFISVATIYADTRWN